MKPIPYQKPNKNSIMNKTYMNGEYVSPVVSTLEFEMQEVIAASNDTTFTIGDYTPGYSNEEDF